MKKVGLRKLLRSVGRVEDPEFWIEGLEKVIEGHRLRVNEVVRSAS